MDLPAFPQPAEKPSIEEKQHLEESAISDTWNAISVFLAISLWYRRHHYLALLLVFSMWKWLNFSSFSELNFSLASSTRWSIKPRECM